MTGPGIEFGPPWWLDPCLRSYFLTRNKNIPVRPICSEGYGHRDTKIHTLSSIYMCVCARNARFYRHLASRLVFILILLVRREIRFCTSTRGNQAHFEVLVYTRYYRMSGAFILWFSAHTSLSSSFTEVTNFTSSVKVEIPETSE